jgi:pimeloyl-ACP methyl ester carboxylesterase
VLPHDDVGAGPAVVLLHAGVADRTMWAGHLHALADAGFRAVAVDLPGFGEAPAAQSEQAPWVDVLRTMDELAIERAALVGNSFGGAVALRVASVAPERVSALVLVSAPAPGVEPSAELEAVWEAEDAARERGDVEAVVGLVVEAWVLPDAPPEIHDQVAAMQRRALALQADTTEATEAPDALDERPEALAELDVPALVIAGGREMRDFTEGAELLARSIPEAQHAVIEEAGHLAPLETPAAFGALLLDFLRAR